VPSGLTALLDDVAALARLTAASLDDVASASAKAGSKAAGVVIDDAAVTPKYAVGLPAERELPIIAKIARGSIRNKLVFLLPAALLLSAFADWLITPLLMVGGCYLVFEGTEKVIHWLRPPADHSKEVVEITDPAELEQRQVSGAIRTDFILSAEIMAIALNELDDLSTVLQAAVLVLVALAITGAVYGAVALIVKMDDVGLHLAREGSLARRALGRRIVAAMPMLLSALSAVGTAAMIWVGGSIIVHGLHEFHLDALPDLVHDIEHAGHEVLGGLGEWLFGALAYAAVGLIIGGVIVAVVLRIRASAESPDHR
jgi:predicted DNA repair protein MutK